MGDEYGGMGVSGTHSVAADGYHRVRNISIVHATLCYRQRAPEKCTMQAEFGTDVHCVDGEGDVIGGGTGVMEYHRAMSSLTLSDQEAEQ